MDAVYLINRIVSQNFAQWIKLNNKKKTTHTNPNNNKKKIKTTKNKTKAEKFEPPPPLLWLRGITKNDQLNKMWFVSWKLYSIELKWASVFHYSENTIYLYVFHADLTWISSPSLQSLPVLWTNCFRQKSMWCWAQLCKPIFDSIQVNFMLVFILTSVAKGSSSGNPTSNRKFYTVPQKTVVRFTHRMQRIFANYKHNRIKVKALFTRTGEKFAHGILMLLY